MKEYDQEDRHLNKSNNLREKIEAIRNKFGERRDSLSKMRLGWFNTVNDNTDLESAKQLMVRGEKACVILLTRLDQLSADSKKKLIMIDDPLKSYSVNHTTVGVAIAVFFQAFGLINAVGLGETSKNSTNIYSIALSMMGLAIYFGSAALNNSQILKQYLKLRQNVINIQIVLQQAQ